MSKPTLSQIVEIAQTQSSFIEIIKDDKYHFVLCEEAVKEFGDVEIKDLGFSMHQVLFLKPNNEYKSRFKVFL